MLQAHLPTRRTAHHRAALSIAALAGLLMLQACGGGGGGAGTPSSDAPFISKLAIDRLSYGRLSTFTATGTNLTSIGFATTGCDGYTLLAGGSATQQVFTCTPNAALSVRVQVAAAGFDTTQAVPKPQVTMVVNNTTIKGSLVVELDPTKAPITVANFMAYVNNKFYDGTIFHRVVNNFVVQGGGFTGVASGTLTPQAGALAPIALEVGKGLSNVRGSIAMARTSVLNSATSEFFINTVDNTALDTSGGGYAVFGTVVSGLALVDAMNTVATQTVGSYSNVPVSNISVVTATQTQ